MRAHPLLLSMLLAGCTASESPPDDTDENGPRYRIGLSNTVTGVGWRDQFVCSVKAEALASGRVSELLVYDRRTDPTGQTQDLRALIAAGVDAILLNPADARLDTVIQEAADAGIHVFSVDTPVTSELAHHVALDQVQYGELGATWLFEKLGGTGRVAYMRGLEGAPLDDDRDVGFQAALDDYPGIVIATEVFTDWHSTTGAQQALEILQTQDVDGIWTSGIDSWVVDQFAIAGVDPVPVVGSDNPGFVDQVVELYPAFEGAVVANPPTIGAIALVKAIELLDGTEVPKVYLHPTRVLDMANDERPLLESVSLDAPLDWPELFPEPATSSTPQQVIDCVGPSSGR